MWIVLIVIIYFVAIFGVSRLFIPHLGLKLEKIPDDIPADMSEEIEKLKSESGSAAEFLEKSWELIGGRYRSERFNTLFKFRYLFKDLKEIWNMRGYIPCTQSSFLLRIFLVKSGFFKEAEVALRHTFVNFCIHQYLRVKINDQWMDVDVGEKQRGMKLGKHLKWFG